MNNSEALALQFMYSQQALEVTPQAVIVKPAPAKVSKLAAVTQKVMAANPPEVSSQPVSTVVVPSKAGSIAGAGFMKLYRKARNRDEVIQAIDLYIGYDPKGSFASQEYKAKQAAQNELNPNRLAGAVKATPAVQGFIAGLPDSKAKHKENLLARERLAADAMIEHEKKAAEAEYGSSERALHEGLAKVECDRLREIRHDLKQLG